MGKKIKHLEIIQATILRMANNSFALKGWAVTLIVGLLALANNDTDKRYYLIVYVPILLFWVLDAYYLWQERLFRKLYNKIREKEDDEINFDMSTKFPVYDFKETYIGSLVSPTIMGFYLPLAILSAGIIIITNI